VVAVLALSLMGIQLINSSRAAATLPAGRGAGGVSLRTNKTMKPVRLDMSKVALAAGSSVVPASVAPLSSLSPACYGDSKSMTPVGGTFDPISYGAFYNCAKQEWTFEVQTEDAWAKNSLGSWNIGIDTDGNFSDDCGGAEYIGEVFQSYSVAGQFLAEIYQTDSNCDVLDPATASIYITGNTVAISFPASDIGNNPSLAWNGFLQSRTEEEMETQPGQDVPSADAIDGPLTGGVLDSIPGPEPGDCDAASTTAAQVATTSKGNEPKLAAALKRAGLSQVRDYGQGVVSFRGDPSVAGRVLDKDGISSHIARSEPYTTESVGSLDASTTSPPDDPDYSSQWNLPVVNAPGAWSVTTGNNIVVADIDTGADYSQTDLAANLVDGYDETTLLPMGPGTTETGDTDTGQTDSGHGTAVAGVIAGVTNNDLGVASLGWNTLVMPIKVDFDDDNVSAQIAAGIDWAAETSLHLSDPVKVINLSFGGTCPDSTVEDAIQTAQSDGILVVAAAGNDALSAGFDLTPDDDQYNDAPVYPASDPNVISVGATGREGYRAAYSNVGDASLVAPGGSADFDYTSQEEVTANDMLLLNAGGGTTTGAGTSFAAPEVAATAALIWSVNPNLTSTQVSELIESTATGLGPSGTNIEYGQGMLNAGAAVSDTPPPTTGFGTYVATPPTRILDTRVGTGAPEKPIGPKQTLTFKVTGTGGAQGVPSTGVAAVVINTTVVNPTSVSYLTVWPTGQVQPVTSNINVSKGQTVPNLVTVKVGAGGDISFYNNAGSIDLVADLAGYYVDGTGTAGSTFVSVPPVRLLDTRKTAPIGSGQHANLLVTGSNGVPSTATGVVLNVTVTQPTAAGYLTVYPASETTPPLASNLNFTKGETVANLAIVQLGTEGDSMGSLSFYNKAGSTDVVVDLEGYLTAAGDTSGSRFFPLVDHRIVDTRVNIGGFDAPVRAGQSIAADIVGQGGVLVGPSGTIGNSDGPSAVVMNVTVTGGTTGGYLTVYPAGEAAPLASNLNFTKGETVANLATTTIGTSGQDDIYNNTGTVEVICDVVGYYGAPGT
jgi:subtilisin family serine protease